MKRNLPGIALLMILATHGGVCAQESGASSLAEMAEWQSGELLYAPTDPALDWAEAGKGARGLDSFFEFAVHPSLAGDLMERLVATEAANPDADLFVAEVETERRPAPQVATQPEPEVEIRQAGAGYDISGVPHPLLAGLAALVGALSLVVRRPKEA